ncbi:MAG: DUF937 domain-containing protein, partial [Maricaulaceae bacterium]
MAINLLDMIMSAENGGAMQHAAQQTGIAPDQAQNAVAALLPAISSALKQNTQTPQGLGGLMQALQGGNHAQYLDNPQSLGQASSVADGNAILGHLFGSKDVSRAVAGHAAEQTGIDSDLLKKMLPLVATMAMGSLSKQTQAPDMKSSLAQLAIEQMVGGNSQQSASGLGGLLGGLLGGGQRKQQARAQQQHQQGLGMIGKMLDAD